MGAGRDRHRGTGGRNSRPRDGSAGSRQSVLDAGDRAGGGGSRSVDRAGLPGRTARRRCHRAGVDERRARARPAPGRGGGGADVFRRQRARGYRRRPRRARSALAGRSRAARGASPRRGQRRGRADRRGRGRRPTLGTRGRSRSGRRHRHFGGGDDRRVGVDRRTDPGDQGPGRRHLQRFVKRGRDLRNDRLVGGGREHLCRHRATGDRGADRQGAICAACRPLCAGVPAVHARSSPLSPG